MDILNWLFSDKKNQASMLEKQWAKNLAVITQLIRGDWHSSREVQYSSIKAFDAWMRKEHYGWHAAQNNVLCRRAKMVKTNSWHVFKCRVSNSGNAPDGGEIFMKDVFTEPFPSSHDMPEWAIGTKLADIMILNGVSVEDSVRYHAHIKHHFVNHSMFQGIIQFDLYKLGAH
jgi:hypothetical protein